MSTTSTRRSSQNSPVRSETTVVTDEDNSTKAEFIYGGPFIKVEKPSPFINTATPINIQLQGTFKKYVFLFYFYFFHRYIGIRFCFIGIRFISCIVYY